MTRMYDYTRVTMTSRHHYTRVTMTRKVLKKTLERCQFRRATALYKTLSVGANQFSMAIIYVPSHRESEGNLIDTQNSDLTALCT